MILINSSINRLHNNINMNKYFYLLLLVKLLYLCRQKYIEENLAKRKGHQENDSATGEEHRYLTPEQAALNSVPEFLRKSSSKKNEEMLSNQVMWGGVE